MRLGCQVHDTHITWIKMLHYSQTLLSVAWELKILKHYIAVLSTY